MLKMLLDLQPLQKAMKKMKKTIILEKLAE